MPRYAVIAHDRETGAESIEGLRVYPREVPAEAIRRLGDGRPALRPVVEIVPDHDPATHRLTGEVTRVILADRVEETHEVAALTEGELKARSLPTVEATVDALIQVVDLLAQWYRARNAWLAQRGIVKPDLLPQEGLDTLTAWRTARRADPVPPRAVGEHVPGRPLGE
jgi:hypothetical protein